MTQDVSCARMRELPFNEAELAAGLDCLDEPWPRVKMERRFWGMRGQAYTLPMPAGPHGDREDQMVYVPVIEVQALLTLLQAR